MRINLRVLTGASAIFLLASQAMATGEPQTSEPDDAYLKLIVSPTILSNSRLEVKDLTKVLPKSDAYGNSLTLQLYDGLPVMNGGTSAELAVDYPYQEGATVRYSWRMMIPATFAADNPANRWCLFARWNDQPNTKYGEKAEMFSTHNPVLMLGYKMTEGVDTLYFSYGIQDAITATTFAVRRNEWMKMVMEITWSRGDKGRAKLFINDSPIPITEVRGANMYGRYHNLFRVGLNRSAQVRSLTSIAIGDINVTAVKP